MRPGYRLAPTGSYGGRWYEDPGSGAGNTLALTARGGSRGADPELGEIRGARQIEPTGPTVRTFGTGRICGAIGCTTKLSQYNPGTHCVEHESGEPERPPVRAVRGRYGDPAVATADVVELVDDAVRELGSLEHVADTIGSSVRRLVGYRRCEHKTVAADVVDRLLMACGREDERRYWECLA